VFGSFYFEFGGGSFSAPFDQALVGTEWFMQAFTLNSNYRPPQLPVEITNGLVGYLPGRSPPDAPGRYNYSNDPNSLSGFGDPHRMLVVELR
jgi:hypothetical protein